MNTNKLVASAVLHANVYKLVLFRVCPCWHFVHLSPDTMALYRPETAGAERAASLCTEGPRPTVSNPALCTSSTPHRTQRYACVCVMCDVCVLFYQCVTSFLWLPVVFYKCAGGRMTKHVDWHMWAVYPFCVLFFGVFQPTYGCGIVWWLTHGDE